MNKLPLETRVQILSMLCEGSSMRSISRVCRRIDQYGFQAACGRREGLCCLPRCQGPGREGPARAGGRNLVLYRREAKERRQR